MDSKYLVIIDVDKIQDYIFATGKLKEIRGASAILSDFNDFGEVERRLAPFCGELLYSGGGNVMALFSGVDGEGRAKNFILSEMAEIKKTTSIATLTGIVEKTSEDEIKEKFVELVLRAERHLARCKESKWLALDFFHSPLIKVCVSCRKYPAEKRDGADSNTLLCRGCFLKRAASSRSRIFKQFCEWLKIKLAKEPMGAWNPSDLDNYYKSSIMEERDLSHIGDKSDGYVGLIVSDGNRMGEKLKTVQNQEKFKELSRLIKESLRESLFEAIARGLTPDASGFVPVEFVLVGGDDLVLVLPTNRAIRVAQDVCRIFQEKTREAGSELSISSGVAIARSKFPISRLHKIGEDLLKSAKRLSNQYKTEEKIEAGCLDFAVISTASSSGIQEIREKEYSFQPPNQNFKTHRRPYRVFDSKNNPSELMDLISSIETLQKEKFPKSRLNQYYKALLSGDKDQLLYDLLRLTARLKEKERKVFNNSVIEKLSMKNFWVETSENAEQVYKNPISDIVELYDFIQEKKSRQMTEIKNVFLKIQITPRTPFHIGSGLGVSGIIDKAMLKDASGLPYIPGSTLKGRIKYHYTRLYPLFHSDPICIDYAACCAIPDVRSCCSVCRIFGSRAHRGGLVFKDALQTKPQFKGIPSRRVEFMKTYPPFSPSIRMGVKISRRRRVAEEKKLFSMEVSSPQLPYETEIAGRLFLKEKEFNFFLMVLKRMDKIGGGKSRGLGAVEITFLPETKEDEQ
ncbi:MAG: hypothetical protein HZA01_16780 [Nitrospinae bacterium]|nr:hypothetical protein [Nitrospinota bacterium]